MADKDKTNLAEIFFRITFFLGLIAGIFGAALTAAEASLRLNLGENPTALRPRRQILAEDKPEKLFLLHHKNRRLA